jgi:hypothetical protein
MVNRQKFENINEIIKWLDDDHDISDEMVKLQI